MINAFLPDSFPNDVIYESVLNTKAKGYVIKYKGEIVNLSPNNIVYFKSKSAASGGLNYFIRRSLRRRLHNIYKHPLFWRGVKYERNDVCCFIEDMLKQCKKLFEIELVN